MGIGLILGSIRLVYHALASEMGHATCIHIPSQIRTWPDLCWEEEHRAITLLFHMFPLFPFT